eukprot:tig00020675_g12630.t1
MSAAPEYASESWFRKLFTGPEEHRLKIGDNDPDWNKDIAAAVRRTVAFVDAELELERELLSYRVLRRLALTGPLLLLRPACFLRRHLLGALKEEISSELEIVLASLDVMVELLVEEAREGPLEARARGELDRLLARRTREAAAAGAGIGAQQA